MSPSWQQRPQPRLELVDVKRLDQIVVGAGVQAVDPVRHRVARGQHQHRHAVPLPTQQAAHLQPVDIWQPDVEHDRIRDAGRDPGQCAGTVVGQAHLVTGQRQCAAQDVAQGTVIVDDEQAHRRIVAGLPGAGNELLRLAYALAEHRTEDPVDEPGRVGAAESLGGFHRFVDRPLGRNRPLAGDRVGIQQLD